MQSIPAGYAPAADGFFYKYSGNANQKTNAEAEKACQRDGATLKIILNKKKANDIVAGFMRLGQEGDIPMLCR